MPSTVSNQTLKVTLSAKVGNMYLSENTFSVANINEVDNRIMTVPLTEATLMLFGTSSAAGTYIKTNLKYLSITNRDDTHFIRLRLKKLITNRLSTLGAITAGTVYPNGSYSLVPLTGGTGSGATANITVLGSVIYTLGTITPGSLYTTGTYTGVALTGGSGTGALATIVVAGGVVTTVTVTTRGTGYVVGDVLSALAANIGGTGSGFSVPVSALAGGVTAVTIVEKGIGYTNGDSLSASNTNLGGNGTGFAVAVSLVESISYICDHKIGPGEPFVLCNTTISTDSSFVAFNDIESISALADTSPVDVDIYVASL